MSIVYSVSTTYSSNGQRFASSIDQGSTYLGVPFASPITFDNTLTVTEPRTDALLEPTVANYPTVPNSYFMGSFDGFWIHKLYMGDRLVATVQSVNQDMFLPISHDRVESVSMGFGEGGSIPCPDCPVRPPVPSVGTAVIFGIAAIISFLTISRSRG